MGIAALSLPGLNVPTGLVDNQIPVGVQLVADRFREDICLAAGEIIQEKAPAFLMLALCKSVSAQFLVLYGFLLFAQFFLYPKQQFYIQILYITASDRHNGGYIHR